MRGCFRGFSFGSIISCRACLARDAAHRHIVATNSAGPDVSCVKCCHFNGLQTYVGGIRHLSGCDPGTIAVIPAKSLASPVRESRLRDLGARQPPRSSVTTENGKRIPRFPAANWRRRLTTVHIGRYRTRPCQANRGPRSMNGCTIHVRKLCYGTIQSGRSQDRHSREYPETA